MNAAGQLVVADGAVFTGGTDIDVVVTADDGALTTDTTFTLSITQGDAPATAITLTAVALNENAAGAVVADIAVTDPDSTYEAADLGLSGADAALFRIIDGLSGPQLALAEGVSLDFEAAAQPSVAVTLPGLASAAFAPAPADVAESSDVAVIFKLAGITAYSTQDRPQDGGAGVAVSPDGGALTLAGNLWKRAALDQSYVVSDSTKLVLDLAIGTPVPEIIAVGFDLDGNAFDSDGSIYQLAGSQAQGAFVDLRGSGEDIGGGVLRFTIDLGSHAGVTLASLVYFADDDAPGNGLGVVTFSNVVLTEGAGGPADNVAPRVVSGGVADLSAPSQAPLEIDLPFVDDNGDPLSYAFSIIGASGAPVTPPEGLAIVDGVLVGPAPAEAGVYTVTVTGNDGEFDSTLSFDLTVEAINLAPESDDPALEPVFAQAGAPFDAAVALDDFAGFFSDPNGDALSLSFDAATLPEGMSVNSEGALVGAPEAAGTYAVIVRATDPGGLSATLTFDIVVDAPEIGGVILVEAENLSGIVAETDVNLFATGVGGASGGRIIRANTSGAVSVQGALAENGVSEGWYLVTLTLYDETDGASGRFSLSIDDTVLANNLNFGVITPATGASLPSSSPPFGSPADW